MASPPAPLTFKVFWDSVDTRKRCSRDKDWLNLVGANYSFPSDYIDSMLENTGDAFKTLYHHGFHANEKVESILPNTVDPYLVAGMLESCKYMARALEAAALFFQGSSNHKHDADAQCDIEQLVESFSNLIQNRSKPIMEELQKNVKPILKLLGLLPSRIGSRLQLALVVL